MASPIVTFLSDFGREDWFVGAVHGVVLTICPEARIVDLTHEIPLGNVERAAFVLDAAAADFPSGSIHLVVVDPGVGTRRRALVVRARHQYFVGPDNGVLEWALSDPAADAFSITETRYFRQPVSRTFHGRDVFAPVAAQLARGEPIRCFGPQVTDAVRLPLATSRREGREVIGRVMFFDRFGNALTNVRENDLAAAFAGVPDQGLEVAVADRTIRGLSRAYGDARVGTLVAIIGSSGRLEIAQVGGDAAARLGLGEGDVVRVRAGGIRPDA